MVSQKYRGSCIGAALAKWLAKNTVASQKMALKEKMEDGALEMLLHSQLEVFTKLIFVKGKFDHQSFKSIISIFFFGGLKVFWAASIYIKYVFNSYYIQSNFYMNLRNTVCWRMIQSWFFNSFY